ncbi:hypothetical protein [uncultured Psychrobacter sp.]|jgi:DNA mismatch repair protein MutH|uniref:hypothetical protein n=1 Tax=uncultured Psychrobacter sp. TaxID=259303 RepID=UPI00262FA7B7|nr:hypothetical protein [uncultured Psychrobacter sp.]
MKIEEAFPLLLDLYNIEFGILKNHSKLEKPIDLSKLKGNKGFAGQFLEKLLGLKLSSNKLDFENGELKTNKSKPDGSPMETMAITQIGTQFDDLFYNDKSFHETHLYHKIESILYVPAVKGEKEEDWYFLPAYYLDLKDNDALKKILDDDFETIKAKVQAMMDTGDGMLHTANGKYMQIRTKDSKPYNPIYSKKLGRKVSDKGFAFYFKKEFMQAIQDGVLPSKKIV